MKKLFLISIFLCCVINSYCQTNFSGEWNWENATSGFSIRISQINNTITGSHCATADNGKFIDCDYEEPSTINGSVLGDSVMVTFLSTYCNKKGTAVIKKINSTQIQWRITKKPDGVSYIPANVVMDLDSSLTVGSFTKQPTKINTNTEVPKKTVPTLIGIWGVSKDENANFAISNDSIYYPDSDKSVKYSVIGDSLFINYDPTYVFRAKYILRNDSLILIDKDETSKFVSLEGPPPLDGSFTMKPGFYNITSGIANFEHNNEHSALFYLAFFPYSTMQVGVNYLVANISANCRPSVQQKYKYNGDKTWEITINPNGDIYFKIICCSSLSSGVGFVDIIYPL